MKTMSKRNKILFGVLGAVVVIVAIGLVIGLTGNLPLQGSSTGPVISPSNVCLLPGQSYHLDLASSAVSIKWSVGDSTVVKLSNATKSGATVTALNKVGYITWVAEKNLLGIGSQAEVGVWHLCPNVQTMLVGLTDRYVTDISGGKWSSSNTAVAIVDANGWVSFRNTATTGQTTTITLTAPNGTKYNSVLTVGPDSGPVWVR